MKRYERDDKTKEIRHAKGLNKSTLHTFRDNREKIGESCKSATCLSTACVSVTRSAIMEKMEHMLTTWILHENEENMLVLNQVIQENAHSIYEVLKYDDTEASIS